MNRETEGPFMMNDAIRGERIRVRRLMAEEDVRRELSRRAWRVTEWLIGLVLIASFLLFLFAWGFLPH